MSYNSKKIISSMAAGVLLAIAYVIRALGRNAPAPEDVKAWAATMLVFVGIGIAAVIVVQILFHIAIAISITAEERDEKSVKRVLHSIMFEDERDKIVGQKASHVAYNLCGVGFCIALIALAAGAPVVLALHIILGFSLFGSLVEGGVSVYLYERGTHNG